MTNKLRAVERALRIASILTTAVCAGAVSASTYTVTALQAFPSTPPDLGEVYAGRINNSGLIAGSSHKYSGATDLGQRAAAWLPGQSVPLELPGFAAASGMTLASATAVNDAGIILGGATLSLSGTSRGMRAMYWPSASSDPVELLHIGTNSSGYTESYANAIDPAGTIFGSANRYSGNTNKGLRALRWPNGASAPQELGNLRTLTDGRSSSLALACDAAGNAYGQSYLFPAPGTSTTGNRAVRWNAGSTTPTELAHLGDSPTSTVSASVLAANPAGTAIGQSTQTGTHPGTWPVMWPAGQNDIVPLGVLSTNATGYAYGDATGINSNNDIVGYCYMYEGNTRKGSHATLWPAGQATPVDLNSLLPMNSGWVLEYAYSINDSGTIVGSGVYDPDGTGPLAGAKTGFRMDVVPEPVSALTLLGLLALSRIRPWQP